MTENILLLHGPGFDITRLIEAVISGFSTVHLFRKKPAFRSRS